LSTADTSYIVEGLLRDKTLLEGEELLTPELTLYEVANTLWKHERLLQDIPSGLEYLNILMSLVELGGIIIVRFDKKLAAASYQLAVKHGITVYDSAPIAIALSTGLTLKTFDKQQKRVFEAESNKKRGN